METLAIVLVAAFAAFIVWKLVKKGKKGGSIRDYQDPGNQQQK